MTDLHPNWQSTDASPEPEEHSLPVRIVEKPHQEQKTPGPIPHQPRMRRLSRQPAALAGMLLAMSIGLSLFFGMDRSAETTIRITQNGFSPKAVTVTPGNTLQWINETTRPHVLQSDALCTRDQRCFSTISIVPGATATLNITEEFAAGTYPYYSISTQGMEAGITILASASSAKRSTAVKTVLQQNLAQATPFDGAGQSSLSSAPKQSSSAASQMNRAVPITAPDGEDGLESPFGTQSSASGMQEQTPSGFSSLDNSATGNRITQLPVNPYTVNSTQTHPFDAQGKPIAPGSGSSSSKGKSTLHGGAPLPLTQPSTGPALWLTLFGSFALLFFVTRNLLKRQKTE